MLIQGNRNLAARSGKSPVKTRKRSNMRIPAEAAGVVTLNLGHTVILYK